MSPTVESGYEMSAPARHTTTPTKKIPPNIAVRAKDFIKSEWIKLTVTATIAIVIGTYFCVKLGLIH